MSLLRYYTNYSSWWGEEEAEEGQPGQLSPSSNKILLMKKFNFLAQINFKLSS
jgi:hypothetical protein